jgi:HlyD family secretion protein
VQTLQQQINEAKANLEQTIETGQEQINQARAELNQTLETVAQEVNQAKAELNQILETSPAQLNQAKATLDKIAEVRPEDVQAASASVERAIAAKEKAQAEYELTSVKAPADGQILKINTRQGERTSIDKGIVELGRTNQMYVIAEVYETDIALLRRGQRATITSAAFTGTLEGTVDIIGKQIGKKDVLDTDPAADTDARVIEVKIRLDPEASQKVANLTNLQVDVKISI